MKDKRDEVEKVAYRQFLLFVRNEAHLRFCENGEVTCENGACENGEVKD